MEKEVQFRNLWESYKHLFVSRDGWAAFLYNLLSLPLAVLYFTQAIVFYCLGLCLLILAIGWYVLLLGAYMIEWWSMMELWITRGLLDYPIYIRAVSPVRTQTEVIFGKRAMIGIWYSCLKLVFSCVFFTLAIVVIAIPLYLITWPFILLMLPQAAGEGFFSTWIGAIVLCLLGLSLLPFSVWLEKWLGVPCKGVSAIIGEQEEEGRYLPEYDKPEVTPGELLHTFVAE